MERNKTRWLLAAFVVVAALFLGPVSTGWADEVDEAIDETTEAADKADEAAAGDSTSAVDRAVSGVDSSVRVAETASEASPSGEPTSRSLPREERQMPGGVPAIAAYLILWVLFGGYLFFVHRHQRRLRDEIDELEMRIDELLGTDGSG